MKLYIENGDKLIKIMLGEGLIDPDGAEESIIGFINAVRESFMLIPYDELDNVKVAEKLKLAFYVHFDTGFEIRIDAGNRSPIGNRSLNMNLVVNVSDCISRIYVLCNLYADLLNNDTTLRFLPQGVFYNVEYVRHIKTTI